MSKGSGRRPESDGSYSAGWDAIFGNRKADQAAADKMRADNLAAAERETEQHAKDGN